MPWGRVLETAASHPAVLGGGALWTVRRELAPVEAAARSSAASNLAPAPPEVDSETETETERRTRMSRP